MKLCLKFGHPDHADEALNDSLAGILEDNKLMSLATVKEGESYVNTAYYAFNDKLDLFFLSNPQSQHCLNIQANDSAAISIFDSSQPWDELKRGVQLFARAEQAQGMQLLEGGALYMKRFVGLKKWITNIDDLARGVIESRLYVLHVHALKLFDEPSFGEDVFLSLTPRR